MSVIHDGALLFTSLDQVREGLLWTDRRQTLLAQYQSLWRNDVSSRPAGITTKWNFYRRVTEFWVDGLWGRKPTNVDAVVADAFEEATKWRSMKGNGVIVVETDGTLRPIDPAQWYPVYSPVDRNQITGHIISFFYRSDPAPDQSEMRMPDRADMLLLDNEGNGRRDTFLVEGQTLGARIASTDAAVRGVFEWGGDYSDYVDLIDLVAAFEHRLSRMTRVLDFASDPHLQGPSDALDEQGKFRWSTDGSSLYLPLESDMTPRYAYLTFDGQLEPSRWVMDEIKDLIHIATSIPLTAFGLDSGSGESGVSRERQLFAALQKLRRLRREVSGPLIAVQSLLGGEAITEVDWPDAPFSGYAELAAVEAALVQAEIIGAVDAREHLGIR